MLNANRLACVSSWPVSSSRNFCAMKAKITLSFLVGCVVGAGVLWFGFAKTVVVLPANQYSSVAMVNRLTGEASYLDIMLSPKQAKEEEEANSELATVEPPDQELDAERVKQLQMSTYASPSQIHVTIHNPLDGVLLTSTAVHVHVPASDKTPSMDRDYSMEVRQINGSAGATGIPPHTDGTGELSALFQVPQDVMNSATVSVTKVLYRRL